MSTDREVARIVRSWLEEGVTALPDRVLDAVLDQVPATPQRRSWWPARRFAEMHAFAKLAVTAAAVVVLAVIGFNVLPRNGGIGGPPLASPSPTPSSSPTPTSSAAAVVASPSAAPSSSILPNPATWSSFTSARGGYTIKYPTGWTVTPATVPWTFASLAQGSTAPSNATGSPAVDEFVGPDRVGFVVSSQKIPAGMSESQWFAAYLSGTQDNGCFPPRSAWTAVSVAGKAGGLHGGLNTCGFTEVVVIDGGRAYVFTGYVNVDHFRFPPLFDRSLLDAFLSTVQFRPAAADDRPAANPAPS